MPFLFSPGLHVLFVLVSNYRAYVDIGYIFYRHIRFQDRPEGGLSESNKKFAKSGVPSCKTLQQAVELVKPNTIIGKPLPVCYARPVVLFACL